MFKRLADALAHLKECPSNNIVIAEDVAVGGQKQFYVNSPQLLAQKYTQLQSPHWYECLLEGVPSRIFLDIESEDAVDLPSILESLTAAVDQKFNLLANIEVLDSCSDKKQSWHVVVTNVYLKNVYHVGAFVRRLVLFTNEDAIDTSVYTKNRMFRVKGSSKYGSDRILRHPSEWRTTLVQWPPAMRHHECLEIDGSEPVSQSRGPSALFDYVDSVWVSRHGSRTGLPSLKYGVPPFLGPLLQKIDALCNGNLYHHKITMTSSGKLFCSTKSKKCAIAGRQHKGNNIWFEIDLVGQRVYQRCYDGECQGKRHEILGNDTLWIGWNNCWDAQQHDHIWSTGRLSTKNENTLYNMVD